MFVLGYVISFWLGMFVGLGLTCCVVASGKSDERKGEF